MCNNLTATANYNQQLQAHANFLMLPAEQKALVLEYRACWRQYLKAYDEGQMGEMEDALAAMLNAMTPEARAVAETER